MTYLITKIDAYKYIRQENKRIWQGHQTASFGKYLFGGG